MPYFPAIRPHVRALEEQTHGLAVPIGGPRMFNDGVVEHQLICDMRLHRGLIGSRRRGLKFVGAMSMDKTTATHEYVDRIGRFLLRGYSNGNVDSSFWSHSRHFKSPVRLIHPHRKQPIESFSHRRRLETLASGKNGHVRDAFPPLARAFRRSASAASVMKK